MRTGVSINPLLRGGVCFSPNGVGGGAPPIAPAGASNPSGVSQAGDSYVNVGGDGSLAIDPIARWHATINAALERVSDRGYRPDQIDQRMEIFSGLESAIVEFERLVKSGGVDEKKLRWIADRIEWNARELNTLMDTWTENYHLHYGKRIDILSNMILDAASDAHMEMVGARLKVRFGKPRPMDELEIPEGESTPTDRIREPRTHDLTPRVRRGDRVLGLVNHDVGLHIPLWPHQIDTLKKIQGAFALHRDNGFRTSEGSGYVVAATGSGKTRTMMATIAMALRKGWFKPQNDDKVIITTHLNIIHDQNESAACELLSPIFREIIGRDVRVSTVGGGKGFDLSGDVVIVSIPAVGKKGTIDAFHRELEKSLRQGTIPILLIDEIHHGEAETWQNLREAIEVASPNRYELGFTATPSRGMKGRRLANYPAIALIPERVLPNVQLVPVETGISLDNLRPSKGDFNERELTQAVSSKKRNDKIFQTMESHGITSSSPSGRLGFAPTLIFGVSPAHAYESIAKDYVAYFGGAQSKGSKLKGRRLEIIGASGGEWTGDGKTRAYKIASANYNETSAAIEKYKRGELDALVAIVWAGMPERVFDLIMEEYQKGNIEAVINCKKLEKGYDAPFVRNIVGAKPTLKGTQKTQEVGRILRWNDGEVDFKRGIILEDNPRVAFDVRNSFGRHGEVQWSYQEALGVVAGGRLAADKKHDLRAIGSRGQALIFDRDVKCQGLTPISSHLKYLLATRYAGDVDLMAYDLGLERHELAALFNINGLANDRYFLEELATLLYLPREALAELRHGTFAAHQDAVIDVLQQGLEIYFGLEGKRPHAFTVIDDRGDRPEKINITEGLITHIHYSHATDGQFQKLALGLRLYFVNLVWQDHNELHDYLDRLVKTMDVTYSRPGWDSSIHALSEMNADDMMRFVRYEEAHIGKTLSDFYLVGALQPSGKIAGLRLVEDASELSRNYFKRRLVRTDKGIRLHDAKGNGFFDLTKALVDNDAVSMSDKMRLEMASLISAGDMRGRKISPSEIDSHTLNGMWQRFEEFMGESQKELYLVGSLEPSGKISGLRLVEDASELSYQFFKLLLVRTDKGIRLHDAKGNGFFDVSKVLIDNGVVSMDDTMKSEMTSLISAGDIRGRPISPSDIDAQILSDMWQRFEKSVGESRSELYLVGRLESSGKISGLRLVEDASELSRNFFKLHLVRENGEFVLCEAKGTGFFDLTKALVDNDAVSMSDKMRLEMASLISAGDMRGRKISPSEIDSHTLNGMWQRFEEFMGESQKELHLVGSLEPSGKIAGLRLVGDVSELSVSYFKLCLVRENDKFILCEARGRGFFDLAKALIDNGAVSLGDKMKLKIASHVAAGQMRWRSISLSKIDAATLNGMWQRFEEFMGESQKELYLVGSLEPSGKIAGLRLVGDVSELSVSYFKLCLVRDENGIIRLVGTKGLHATAIAAAIFGPRK